MSAFILRWASSFIALVKQYRKRVLVTVGGAIVTTILGMWQEAAVIAAWGWLMAALSHRRVAVLAIVLMLTLFILLSVLLLVAYVDAWRAGRTKKPLPLSLQDRQSIEAARVIWRKNGREAWYALHQILDRLRRDMEGRQYWSVLLDHELSGLKQVGSDIDTALADGSVTPLKEVQERLERFIVIYQRGANWVSKIGANDIPLDKEPYAAALKQWLATNREFLNAFADLAYSSYFTEAKFLPANHEVLTFMGLENVSWRRGLL